MFFCSRQVTCSPSFNLLLSKTTSASHSTNFKNKIISYHWRQTLFSTDILKFFVLVTCSNVPFNLSGKKILILMSLVLMTDKLVARLHFSSVFLISCIVAGLTAALGSDSALRRHILCLVILLKHKGLVLQAENAHKISSFVSEHWLVTYFGFIPAGCLSLCPVLCPLLD